MKNFLIFGGVALVVCVVVGVYVAAEGTITGDMSLTNKHARIDPRTVSVLPSQYCNQETHVAPVRSKVSYSCGGDCTTYDAVFTINQTSPKVAAAIKTLDGLVSRSNNCEIFGGKIGDVLSDARIANYGQSLLAHLGITCSDDQSDASDPKQADIDETFCGQADLVVRSLAGAQGLMVSEKRNAIAQNIRAEMEKRQWHSDSLLGTGIFSFRGSQFNDSLADVLIHEGQPPDACAVDAKECSLGVAGRISDNITYYFADAHMTAFTYTFPFSEAGQMLTFLTHEYGEPTSTEEQNATTEEGQTISYSTYTWKTPDGPLVLFERYNTLDMGAIIFNESKIQSMSQSPFGTN